MSEIHDVLGAQTGKQVSLTGLTILVIEDDIPLLRSLGARVANEGADVVLAADGAAGLEAFTSRHVDLVITDIIMPEREGVETLMAIKRQRPQTPILAISGGGRLGGDEFLTLARRLGADATLAKPFRSDDLLTAIRSLISQTVPR